MNNEELINEFEKHMPETLTRRQRGELLNPIREAICGKEDAKITISEDKTVLTCQIKEGNKTTTHTIDIKKLIPKKKNKFIEWLNS